MTLLRTSLLLIACTLIIGKSVFGQEKLKKPDFNKKRGFYDKAISLKLTDKNNGTKLYYSLDGSIPSDTQGIEYKKPVRINKTTVVRAASVDKNGRSSRIATHTFLFPEDVLSQADSVPGWPRPTLNLDYRGNRVAMDYEMDPEVIAMADKQMLIEGLKDIPVMALSMPLDNFWKMTKGSAEMPVSIEFIYPEESEQEDGGIEGMSHRLMKRTYRLSFKKKYGSGKMKSKLLQDYAPLNQENAADKFDQLVIRAGTQRSWARNWLPNETTLTRDQWNRDTQLDMVGMGSRGIFVHMFINGVYHGLHNVCERPDEKFVSTYFGGEDEEWCVINHNGELSGDASRFNLLQDSLMKMDLTVDENYSLLKEFVDVEQFSDYLLQSWFIGMADWPENNFYCAYNAAKAGPLIFFAWDAELSWDSQLDGNAGAWVHPEFRHDEEGFNHISELWHALRKNPEFMMDFADRVYKHCFNDGVLTEKANIERWDALNQSVEKAIWLESARWGDALAIIDSVTRTPESHWKPEVDRVREMMKGNGLRFIDSLRAEGYYPEINPPTWNQHGGTVSGGFKLKMEAEPGVEIYYTLNGADPRDQGGELNSDAKKYKKGIAFEKSSLVKARARKGDLWSAVHQAVFEMSAEAKKGK